ncbi:MAG TPA: PLP-dependent aminotransferase family protein, partial [Lachnospiraceae bacterium]|nr:PLP-dependent aminotransferase family protein [Lachnospiraceae bacterium]
MWITINKDFQDDSRASFTQKNPSLARQIYTQIRYLILEGKLKEGDKIPSSRELAKDLDVSRNTILEAYNQLIAEGYLDGIHGSGTVVAKGISNFKLPTIKAETTASLSCAPLKNNSRKINFQSGIPDLHRFPKKEFAKLYQVVWNELSDNALRYQSAAGILELRQAIVSYLYRSRGINCSVRNLMIVSGATQGLSLLSKLLYDNDRKVIMENPTHDGLMQIIAKEGYQIVGVRSDDYGLNTDLLE